MNGGWIDIRARRHGWKLAWALPTLAPGIAHAADGTLVGATAAMGILAGMAILSRSRPVGGWLLLFYVHLGAILLGGLVSLFLNRTNLEPGGWDDRGPWLAYLGSLVPQMIALVWAGLQAARLLAPGGRGPAGLQRLRRAYALYIGCTFLAVAIDFAFWPEQVAFDLVTIAIGLCWLAYLCYSRRVRRVLGAPERIT